MKKLTLLAVLVCGVSFSSMASNGDPTGKVQLKSLSDKELDGKGVQEDLLKVKPLVLVEYDCVVVKLICDLYGYICGENSTQIQSQRRQDEVLYCGHTQN